MAYPYGERHTPSRADWQFEYPTRDVRNGASERLAYHERRLVFWRAEFEKIKGEIGPSITIENVESVYKMNAAGSNYGRPELAIDHRLTSKFRRVADKVLEHKAKVGEYHRWVAVLTGAEERKPSGTLPLSIDDVTFFALHDNLDEEEKLDATAAEVEE